MKLTDAIDLLLIEGKSRRLSPRTIEMYVEKLGRLREYLGDVETSSISIHQLREFLSTVPIRSGPKYYQCIRRLFRFLVSEELLEKNPALRLRRPRVRELVIEPLTGDEIQKLFATARSSMPQMRLRDTTILATLLGTGIRAGELIALRDEDVRVHSLLINGKGDRQRIIPLPLKLSRMLIKYRALRPQGNADAFFRKRTGEALSYNHLDVIFRRLSEASGVKVWPHRCRHTFASAFMSEPGANVLALQAICGWRVLAMANRYAKVSYAALAASMDAHSPINALL